ncbi:hypothetical protein F8388_019011, partial [Cannabis sativa]
MVDYLINKHPQLLVIVILLIFVENPKTIWFISQAQALNNSNGSPTNTTAASAVLVFGDSTVDPGNNNYLPTIFKSNFLPYGRDLANKKPTGRFCNGRLTTDFLASYVGLKDYVPPYLDPSLSMEELMTGVSFASAGSGYDPITPQVGNVLPVLKQLEYFKEYKKRLESSIGKQETEHHINKAIFVISAGTNDFIVNYFTLPIRRKIYTTLSSYDIFLMEHVKTFLQPYLQIEEDPRFDPHPSGGPGWRNISTFRERKSQERGVSMEGSNESFGFNKRRTEGRDKDDKPKRSLQLKTRKLNPSNTICYLQ